MSELILNVLLRLPKRSIVICNFTGKLLKAFTLAEVLITLSIIGVIASMTIPSLVQDVQEAQWKAGYKKAFAVGSQAWRLALTSNTLTKRTSNSDPIGNRANFNAFKAQFQVIKDCPTDSTQCFNSEGEKWGGSYPASNSPSFIDSSGMAWGMCTTSLECIIMDTNGFKGPNKLGRDRFYFTSLINNSFSTYSSPGIPIKLAPYLSDSVGVSSYNCPSANCYYQSWLKN